MQVGHLAIGMAGAASPTPPLSEAGYRGVVKSHFHVEPAQPPSALAQAHRKLGIFARNHRRVVETNLSQRGDAKERIPAATGRFADRGIPLIVTQRVVY